MMMKKFIVELIIFCLSLLLLPTLFGCENNNKPPLSESIDNISEIPSGEVNHDETESELKEHDKIQSDKYNVTSGLQEYHGFTVDNVYHSENSGDIHFHLYVPESYDGSTPYALYISLCGYGGYYFQGVGINLRQESFAFEAQKYNDEMIIVTPQLNDWHATSANQTIALTEYFFDTYNIDRNKVFMNGYSGGGETLSLIMGKKPELYTAVLHVASVWDGELQPLVNSKVPVYFVIGESDEYYGSERISATYRQICEMYRQRGLTDSQIAELAVLDIKDAAYFGSSNQHGGYQKSCLR